MKYFKSILCTFSILYFVSCTNTNDEEMQVDCSASNLSLEVINSTRPDCAIAGSIEVEGFGGVPPYSYSINNQPFQISELFSGLAAGSFTIVVRDKDGCMSEVNFDLVGEGNSITINTSSEASDCSSSNGSITVSASGEGSDFTYSLNGGAEQESNVFGGITAGTYFVTVKDSDGCSATQSAVVDASVSLVNDIMPILEAQCTFSGCHPSYSNKNNVLSRANNIKSRTGNGSMPRSPGVLTQDEIDLIACWVDGGANDN